MPVEVLLRLGLLLFGLFLGAALALALGAFGFLLLRLAFFALLLLLPLFRRHLANRRELLFRDRMKFGPSLADRSPQLVQVRFELSIVFRHITESFFRPPFEQLQAPVDLHPGRVSGQAVHLSNSLVLQF